MADWELWLADDAGARIDLIETWLSIDYTITWTPGKIGVIKVTLADVDDVWLQPDRILYLYRRPEGGRMTLEQAGFLRRWQWDDDGEGSRQTTLWAYDANELLSRRIVAYYAGTDEAKKADFADDMMKEIVAENLLTNSDYSGTETGRAMPSAQLSVQADTGSAPSITKRFAWREVARVLADIADVSRSNGTPLYYRVAPAGEGKFEFRTYTERPGRDRRWPGGQNPLLFGTSHGNLTNLSYEVDHTGEENIIYAGGQDQGTNRTIGEASDSDRINVSAWGRREGFYNASNSGPSSAAVTAAAEAELAQKRPVLTFNADFISTPETPYGGLNGWRAGDEVTAIVREGLYVDCVIEAIQGKVRPGEVDDITGRARAA